MRITGITGLKKSASLRSALIMMLAWIGFHPASAQTLFTQGDSLSNRNFNTDNGPTNSQLTLDFPITQSGTLQYILTWGENSGANGTGVGQSFEFFVLRPAGYSSGATNYLVAFATGYLTVTNVGTNMFGVTGPPFGVLPSDVIAHYGRGIPFNNGTGGPSSVYIASNLPMPSLGGTITVASSVYPEYNDGGRNYAIQVVASSYLVTTTNDSGPGSLRQTVLNAAALGGTGTISFATNLSGQAILLTNGPIVLSNSVTIDGGGLQNGIRIDSEFKSSIFTVSNGTMVFNSLTFTNGDTTYTSGGAIQNNSGTVTVNNCIFTECAAYDEIGGAIANLQGTMTVNNCTFTGNFADNLDPEQFTAPSGGGAIGNMSGQLTVNNCSFIGNSAAQAVGGAIYNTGAFPITVNNCTFFGNVANNGAGGGGIGDQSGTALAVNNCTFIGNSATNSGSGGGGIYTTGNLAVTNSIICSDLAPSGPEIFCAANLSLVSCLIGPEVASLHEGSLVVNSGNQFSANPFLAPLANYGGPTPTMLPLPGSPAINAGVNSVTNFLATDQRGLPRKSGANVDIGAVEAQPGDNSTVVTTTADGGSGSLRIAALLAGLGASNRITFAPTLSGQTILLTSGPIVVTNNITVDASPLTKAVQINGNNESRVLEIMSNSVVTLNSLIITNGYNEEEDYGGGGILNLGTLTLTNCTIINNYDDRSSDGGGGLDNSGTITINNCVVTGNSEDTIDAGGIASYGSMTISNSVISQNGSGGTGGGIFSQASATINNSTISGNYGGGIYNGATLTINASTISDNQLLDSFFGGAGIVNLKTLTLNNCTITGNVGQNCDYGGGGVLNFANVTMNSCTVAANSVIQPESGGGGGLLNSYITGSPVMNMTNCILYSNTAPTGTGQELENDSGSMNIAYSLLGPENNGAIYFNVGTVPNLINSTLGVNSMLAPLGNYGGPTQTMPPEPGSPAIGAGNVTAASQFATDQRGTGFARVVSGKVDIGSVEIQSGQNYNIVENNLDAGPGSLRQVLSNAPADATVTFETNLSGQTIALTTGQIVLTNSVTINGSTLAQGVQISGSGASRIFQMNSGVLAIIEDLTLTNGNAGSANSGGAIYNGGGALTELAGVTLVGNSSGQGGAIENEGTCYLFECTLTGNHAVPGTGSASGNGGAIDNNSGPLYLYNCTIVSNSAAGTAGGLANFENTATITNSIIAANTGSGGGDIYNFGSSTINAGGTNLVQSYGNGGTLNGSATLIAKAPLLAPLGDYGGLTPTMPPLRGSPAIDGGNNAGSADLTADQRGFPRFSGARVDIGAVEVQLASTPFLLGGFGRMTDGAVQFGFTNVPHGSFTVFASTNVAAPFNTWSNLGAIVESPAGSGQFLFTDTKATNFSRRFYCVSSP